MTGRLGLDHGFDLLLHFPDIHSLDGTFLRRMQAGLELSVGSQPDPVAASAKVIAERADQPDAAHGAGQMIAFCDAVILKIPYCLGDTFQDR